MARSPSGSFRQSMDIDDGIVFVEGNLVASLGFVKSHAVRLGGTDRARTQALEWLDEDDP